MSKQIYLIGIRLASQRIIKSGQQLTSTHTVLYYFLQKMLILNIISLQLIYQDSSSRKVVYQGSVKLHKLKIGAPTSHRNYIYKIIAVHYHIEI